MEEVCKPNPQQSALIKQRNETRVKAMAATTTEVSSRNFFKLSTAMGTLPQKGFSFGHIPLKGEDDD